MLAGIQHLSDMGIDNLTNAAGAPAAIQQLIQDVPRIADTAEFVREEVNNKTPSKRLCKITIFTLKLNSCC